MMNYPEERLEKTKCSKCGKEIDVMEEIIMKGKKNYCEACQKIIYNGVGLDG